MSTQQTVHGYDHVLKLIFSHPIMMEHLIKGFVAQDWTHELDFSTLRKINVKHTTDDLRTRENDLIWRIASKGKPLYIICLLEFQSTVDNFMAVRILTYIGLIYQDLIKQKPITLIEDNKLPPIFSLVFYTGPQPWHAPTKLKDCLCEAISPVLRKYQPNIEYFVLDVGQIKREAYNLEEANNLVSSFIGLETVYNLTNLRLIVDKLIIQLQGEQFNSLRKAFVLYLNRVWKPKKRFARNEFIELSEVNIMLSERIEQWEQEKIEQGLAQGILKGHHEAYLANSLQLLEHKFPHIDESFKASLNHFSHEELKLLFRKILEANNVKELID